MTDIVVIGGSCAGLTAAIYATRAGYSVTVLEEKAFGGQAATAAIIENYPAIDKISGFELANRMKSQAEKSGAVLKYASALSIEKENNIFTVVTDSGDIECKSVIIANGVKRRELGVKGEDKFKGKGISFCAVCDGAFFKNKTVAVVGGADSALSEAIYLSSICSRVYLIFRRTAPTASKTYIEKIMELENVKIVPSSRVVEFSGEKLLESITVENVSTNEKTTFDVNGVFEAVGLIPDNKRFENLVELTDDGYIKANEDCKTSTNGIFAAGDTREKTLRQIVTATADGAVSATNAIKYLETL